MERAMIAMRWGSGDAQTSCFDSVETARAHWRQQRSHNDCAIYINDGDGWKTLSGHPYQGWRDLDAIWAHESSRRLVSR